MTPIVRRVGVLLVVGLVVFGTATVAWSCLQTYGTDMHGHTHVFTPMNYSRLLAEPHDVKHWEEQRDRLLQAMEQDKDFRLRTDYAVALAHLGEYPEALKILQQVEQEHPGEYIVAANLGTLYELTGDVDRALEWIKKGIDRNQEAHYGTEWLHARILEAKQKLAADPKWLETHSVLGLDFGSETLPKTPAAWPAGNDGKPLDLKDTADGVAYQMAERVQFVAPPNAIVADLLFDLATIVVLDGAVEPAIPIYELAQKYQTIDVPLHQTRLRHFRSLAAGNRLSGKRAAGVELGVLLFVIAGLGLGGLLILVVGGWFAWRWWARNSAQRATLEGKTANS